jgi:polyferredoxin
MENQDGEVLDATVPDPNQAAPGLDTPGSKAYDPDEFKDQARKRIAYWLLALLTLLVTYAFGGLFLIEGKPTFEHLKSLVEMLLGPLIALVSAATGFYFGAQSVNKKGKS